METVVSHNLGRCQLGCLPCDTPSCQSKEMWCVCVFFFR